MRISACRWGRIRRTRGCYRWFAIPRFLGSAKFLTGRVFRRSRQLCHIRSFDSLPTVSLGRLRTHILHAATGRHDVGYILVVLLQLHKVGNVEEGIALQPNVDEGGLHPGQHSGDTAFVDRPR